MLAGAPKPEALELASSSEWGLLLFVFRVLLWAAMWDQKWPPVEVPGGGGRVAGRVAVELGLARRPLGIGCAPDTASWSGAAAELAPPE